jgi:XRE family transcriptional regulator, regulator of sulfur utilization
MSYDDLVKTSRRAAHCALVSGSCQGIVGWVTCSFVVSKERLDLPQTWDANMIVRKLRLQRGWSQDQLAELMDVSVRTVQRLERGHQPSLETAKALASVFEVDVSSFNLEKTDMLEKAEIKEDEKEAIEYAKGVKEFFHGLVAYVVMAVIFFAVFGFDQPILYWIFLGIGAGLAIQALFTFEIFRFSFQGWEKRIAEKRLGRKL